MQNTDIVWLVHTTTLHTTHHISSHVQHSFLLISCIPIGTICIITWLAYNVNRFRLYSAIVIELFYYSCRFYRFCWFRTKIVGATSRRPSDNIAYPHGRRNAAPTLIITKKDEVNPLPRIAEGTSSFTAFLLYTILYPNIYCLSRKGITGAQRAPLQALLSTPN